MRCFVSLTLLLSLATASASAQERRSDIPLISVVGNGEARVEDLALIGRLLDAGVGAGANTLEGVEFGLRNETPARIQALASAVAEAKRKASAIADALGVRLVRVQDAEEGGVRVIPPLFQG